MEIKHILAASTAVLGIAFSGAAVAQDQGTNSPPGASADSVGLADIVVTAARGRKEQAQATPLALTVMNQKMLEDKHVNTLAGLQQLAPNLTISQTVSQGNAVSVYLRGFGVQTNDPASDPKVAIFVDGIYQPATLGTFLDMFDIDSVEVLNGPQATLLGRNAPVGALSITTGRPKSEFGGAVQAQYGRFDRWAVRGKVNVPIIEDVLLTKFSFGIRKGGNWVRDIITNTRLGGENEKVGRFALLFTPDSHLTWDFTTTYSRSRTPQPGNRPVGDILGVPGDRNTATQPGNPIPGIGAIIGADPRAALSCYYYPGAVCPTFKYGTTAQTYNAPNKGRLLLISSKLSYALEPFTISSLTGYYDNHDINNSDVTGTQYGVLRSGPNPLKAKQFSEEVRLSSNKDGGADFGGLLDWVVGGFYSHYKYYNENNLCIACGLFGAGPPTFGPGPEALDVNFRNVFNKQRAVTKNYAAFASLIFNLTDQWSSSFGIRHSVDKKSHEYLNGAVLSVDTPRTFKNTSIEVGTSYKFTPSKMVYARYAEGYQAGGFIGFPSAPGAGSSFKPETSKSYELGAKTDWFNHRLRVNLALFVNKFSDLQVQGVRPDPLVGFVQATTNAGAATTKGAELQIEARPTDPLSLHFDVGYLDAKYDRNFSTVCSNTGAEVDCSGLPFSYAPKLTINAGASYKASLGNLGSATFYADVSRYSSQYRGAPPIPLSYQKPHALANAGISFTDPEQKYTVELFGTNIFNKKYISSATSAGGLTPIINDGRPAEWGIRGQVNF